MKYLLDTNTCIYFLNQHAAITEKMSKIPVADMAMSIITVAELQFGAYNSSKIRANMERISYLRSIIDLFNNPVGCLTSLAVFQAKALQNCGF